MNCSSIRDRLSAWCDGQIDPAEAAAIEAHLLECDACCTLGKAMRTDDAALRRVFQPHRDAAARIAHDVVAQLDLRPLGSVSLPPAQPYSSFPARAPSLLLATAAGFLLAVITFQPWKNGSHVGQGVRVPSVPRLQDPPVAHLVSATGEVEFRQPGAENWQAAPSLSIYACPSGSAVRTSANVQCELKTSSGGMIRLNDHTQIKFAARDVIEIERGQISCSTPQSMEIKVLAPAKLSSSAPADALWAFTCPSASCMQTAVEPDGAVQVSASIGEIEVSTPAGRERLKRGETASIAAGTIRIAVADDPLLSTRWTQPLLICKGYDNRELGDYVDHLLARIGESKMSYLYEQDIRSLGEYAALPLIRYVASSLAKDDPRKRQTAMRIVADIAPSWTIADLIGLLGDDDAETRFLAASALQRLTGLDQGRHREAWREDLSACQPTIVRWRRWWDDNQRRYPPPPAPKQLGSQA